MGVISSNNFDPTRGYVGVRLQQGVPIVDRDWNEMEDIRKFELRAFLKWFIGDGVPSRAGVSGGNDAFKIDSPGGSTDANDFIIRAGGGTKPPSGVNPTPFDTGLFFEGTFLAGGIAAIISTDTTFTSQPLHVNQAGASTLAGNWGVPVIQALSLPTPANTEVVVYLDVWDRLVTPTEDPRNLILPGLGTESCARTRREWVVRTRTPQAVASVPTAPMPGDSDYLSGHGYSMLASIVSQTAGSNMVNPGDITDLRQTRLNLVELLQRVNTLERLTLFPAFDPSPNQFAPKTAVVGQPVQLLGRNFTIGTPKVLFGATPATNISANISGTRLLLSAVIPPGVKGNVHITVTTDISTAVSDDTLNVIPQPTLKLPPDDFSPKQGGVGQQVTLSGTNFDGPNLQVFFGTIAATITSATATQIVTSVPQGVTGGANITIRVVTDFGSVTSSDTFLVTIGAPAFASSPNQFSPKTGTVNQGITLFGTNFNGDNPKVAFLQAGSTTPATIVGTPTATQIVVNVPNVPSSGQYKISVTTDQGTTTSNDFFTVI